MRADQPRSDSDDQPGASMQLAAKMLRRGDDLCTVAELTGVPVALLELLQREQHRRPHRRRHRLRRRGHQLSVQLVLTVLLLEFVAVSGITVAVTGLINHHIILAITSGVAAVALTVAAWVLIRRSRLPGPPPQAPPGNDPRQ